MGSSDVFNPQSPLARATLDLFNFTLIMSAGILALVTGLVVYCLIRFRARPNQPEPRQFRGHKKLEIAWTLGPLLLLVYLFVLTVGAMKASDPPKADQQPDIIVVGHQFWWEIRYPQSGIVTANEIRIPTGRKLLVELRTADVIHSFWVPELSRKMDMIGDRANKMWLQANRPGSYRGACSEFCGVQHAWMRILVIAEPLEEFEQWQRRQIGPVSAVADGQARRGAELFQKLTCVSCHAVSPETASLQAGPHLRHLAGRRTLAAGVLENNPENLARWLKNPQALKPGNLMPNMKLSDEQVADLVAYLYAIQ